MIEIKLFIKKTYQKSYSTKILVVKCRDYAQSNSKDGEMQGLCTKQ